MSYIILNASLIGFSTGTFCYKAKKVINATGENVTLGVIPDRLTDINGDKLQWCYCKEKNSIELWGCLQGIEDCKNTVIDYITQVMEDNPVNHCVGTILTSECTREGSKQVIYTFAIGKDWGKSNCKISISSASVNFTKYGD